MTPTERIRLALRGYIYGNCGTCGQPVQKQSAREVATQIGGISHTTIARFLAGHSTDSDTLDKIDQWLASRPPR